MTLSRRVFLGAAMAGCCGGRVLGAATRKRPKIVLRSSWQMVNIGDIAHTPGVLTLLERYVPEAEVILWASAEHSEEVSRMEKQRFSCLKGIVKGRVSSDGKEVTSEALKKALDECDFLLHGSGASFVDYWGIRAAVRRTGKPYGVWGITYSGSDPRQQEFMSTAQFLFFRDSVSLEVARGEGITTPVMEFGPDGAFAVDLRNEAAAERFLEQHALEPGKFVCVIPRYRVTPYWKIRNKPMTDKDRENWALSQQWKEHDHAPLRKAIETLVRETDYRVLICPEDQSQVALGKEMLYDPLPEVIRQRVVWRDSYWLTDEAVSTYIRSAGLFGLEMHSPIMCIGNGVPAIVCRFRQQTSKGLMWRDIGLGEWLFDMDREEEIPGIVPAVLDMVQNRETSLEKVRNAQKIIRQRQDRMGEVLRAALEI